MEKYISDVFDIDKEVAEHGNKIMIIAGVGSGKSTWVKDVLTQKGSVLFVSSRKAKILEDSLCSCFSEVFQWYTNGNQTIMTNAKLASLVEKISLSYTKDIDEFINHFDYIVIDEVHSLATDSTYAPSCTSVLSFIEYVSQKGKIVVVMTGTPEPIEYYFIENQWHIIDYRKECIYVHPKKIVLTTKNSVFGKIKTNWNVNQIVYFANRTNNMISLCEELLKQDFIYPEEIGLIVSKGREKEFWGQLETKFNKNQVSKIKNTSEEVYDSIIQNKTIPAKCKLLFSTSTLREGIDIENKDIIMFCENHVLSNLIQFFGRARNGSKAVYVIENVADHSIEHKELLYDYACAYEIESANRFLVQYIYDKKNIFTIQEQEQFIKHVTNNPYIYYDYINNMFKATTIRYLEEIRLLHNATWKYDLLSHCQTYDITFQGIMNMQATMVDALQKMYEKGMEFGLEYKPMIFNVLKWAYKITDEQPIAISEKLKEKGVSYRLLYDKWNKGEKRNKTYWKFVSIQEYEKWLSKRKKIY